MMFNINIPYIHDTAFLMSLTHAQETCTQKLVQVVVWYKKLAHVGQSCTSLFLVLSSSIPGKKLSGTWLQLCNVIGRRVVFLLSLVFSCFRDKFIWLLHTKILRWSGTLIKMVSQYCSQNDVCVCSFGCRLQFPPLYLHKTTCTSLFVFLERVPPALYNQKLCSVSRK